MFNLFRHSTAQVWVDYAGMRLVHPSVKFEGVPEESSISAFFDGEFWLEVIYSGWGRYDGESESWSFYLSKTQGLVDLKDLLAPYSFH